MQTSPLSYRAQGKWRGILPELGISADFLTNKHGPCPMCGGKDRFRFDDKGGRGTWICNTCGAGDGIELVKLKLGCDFKAAAPKIEALLGAAPAQEPKAERSEADKRAAMTALWRSGKPIEVGDAAAIYLASRCGISDYPTCLRFVHSLRYHGEPWSDHPAMIAKVTAPDGSPATVHRTYLRADGKKASVEAPRRLMPGTVAKGSAIRLYEPTAATLGIAEGIETAIAAWKLFKVPCWAAINSTMLANWLAPAGVKEVIVFGDNDKTFAGQAAAYVCAFKNAAKGKTAHVEIPKSIGADWDDELMREFSKDAA